MRRGALFVTRSRWALLLGLASVLGAGAFLFDRYWEVRRIGKSREGLLAGLRRARDLGDRYPHTFGAKAQAPLGAGLKSLVQEEAGRRGIQIAFLTESEKEVGKGRREKQVSARVVRAEHARLVNFLAELERQGGGARVKELRLRPSKDTSGVYDDAEIVLARSFASPGGKP